MINFLSRITYIRFLWGSEYFILGPEHSGEHIRHINWWVFEMDWAAK